MSGPIPDRQRFGRGEGCQLPADVTVTVLRIALSLAHIFEALGHKKLAGLVRKAVETARAGSGECAS